MTPEEAFVTLIKKLIPSAATITVGTVLSVDKEKRTCDVERDGQPTLYNCRLNAIIENLDSYITSFPAIGSFVLCITLNEPTACYVFATSAIEEIQLKIGDTTAVINNKDIVLNGGMLDGLLKLKETTDKINNLEKQLNNLKSVFSGWTVAPNDGGSALKGAVTSWAGDTITLTQTSELENKKVKQ